MMQVVAARRICSAVILVMGSMLSAEVGASADLAMDLRSFQDRVSVGDRITYSAVLSNLGPEAVREVAIRMPVPEGTTLQFATLEVAGGSQDCRISGGVVECNWPFALGSTTTTSPRRATIVVTASAPGAITATATAQAVVLATPPPPPSDPNPSNNVSTVVVMAGVGPVGVPGPTRLAWILLGVVVLIVGVLRIRT